MSARKKQGRAAIIKEISPEHTSMRRKTDEKPRRRETPRGPMPSSSTAADFRDDRTLIELLNDYEHKPPTDRTLLDFWKRAIHVTHDVAPSPGDKGKDLAQMRTIIKVAGAKDGDKHHLYGDLARVAEDWADFAQLCVDNGYATRPKLPSLGLACDMAGSIPSLIALCTRKPGENFDDGWDVL